MIDRKIRMGMIARSRPHCKMKLYTNPIQGHPESWSPRHGRVHRSFEFAFDPGRVDCGPPRILTRVSITLSSGELKRWSPITEKQGEIAGPVRVERAHRIQGRPPSVEQALQSNLTSCRFEELEKSKDRRKFFAAIYIGK